MEIKVEDIINVTKGRLITGNKNMKFINFSKDTRTIEQGDIYIGIKGENFDGSKFWKKAIENGASGVIVQNIEITEEEKKQ